MRAETAASDRAPATGADRRGAAFDGFRDLLAAADGPALTDERWTQREAELWKAGNPSAAVLLGRLLVCSDPGDFGFLTTCGTRLAKLAMTREATTFFEIAARLRPDPKVAIRLADCYLAAGRWQAAVAVLRDGAAAAPLPATKLALVLAEHGPAAQAMTALLDAARLGPPEASRVALADAALRLKGQAGALAVWRSVGRPVTDTPSGYMRRLGVQLARAGELLAAVASLDRARRHDPDDIEAGIWLAWVRRRLSWRGDPIVVRYREQKFDLEREDEYERLGHVVVQNQHTAFRSTLIGILREHTDLASDQVDGYLCLGLLHHGLLEPQHAVRQLAEAVRLAPDDPRCVVAYARSVELDRRPAEAVAVLDEAARRLVNAPAIIEEWAGIFMRTGKPAEALEVARRGAAKFPDHHPLHTTLAVLARQAGRYDEACTALQTAFSLRAAQLDEVEELALMLMVLGRHEEAAAALSQGIASSGRRQSIELRAILAETARKCDAEGSGAGVAQFRQVVGELRIDYLDFRRVGMLMFLSKADEECDRAVAVLRAYAAEAPSDLSKAAHLFYFLLGLNRISPALSHWLDTVRPLCGDRAVLPDRPFQRAPRITPGPSKTGPAAGAKPERSFGLVIQGPVTHRGFDGRDNIARLVDDFGQRFKAIVLSTWEGELDPGLTAGNFHAVFSRDTTPTTSRDGIPLRNRVRQMFSTKAGIDRIRQLGGVDYVIKIRTDLHADLNVLCDHVLHCERNFSDFTVVGQKNFIFTPSMQCEGPYLTGDVMFAGHIDDFENFVLATLETQDEVFRPSKNLPENDMILKHLYRNIRPVLNVPDYMNFAMIGKKAPPVPYPKGLLEYWAEVVRHSLSPMPRRLFETARFRGGGSPMNVQSIRRIDFETWVDVRADLLAHMASRVDGWYDMDAEEFDHVYFYYLEKAVEMAGVALSGDFRLALRDYRAFVDKSRAAIPG